MFKKSSVAATLGMLLFASSAFSQELIELEPDIAQLYASLLGEKLNEVKDPQVKIELDLEKAVGLALGTEGIIVVPTKGLDPETATQNPEADKEAGAALGVIFMSPRFNPLIDGKEIDKKKLRTIVIPDPEGNETEVTALIISAHHTQDDEWLLYAFGTDKNPLISAPFGEAEEIKEDSTLAIDVKDIKDSKGTLVLTVFGMFASSFEISHNVEE